MSGSVNKAIIVGRLGRDPEVKSLPNGGSIATMSIATEETWKDKNSGERKKRTEWHRVVCFNDKLAEIIGKFLTKGAQVYIEGQINTRKWTDQAGVEKYTTEIVLPKFGGILTMLSTPQTDATERRPAAAPTTGGKTQDQLDDEIPF